MQTRKVITLLTMVTALALGLAGCGSDDSGGGTQTPPPDTSGSIAVNETIAISDLQAHIANMDTETLRTSALEWKSAIDGKVAEFTELTQQVAAKTAQALLDEDVKKEVEAINAKMGPLKDSIIALTERFNIIHEKIVAQGGDVSDLEIKKII